MGKNISIAVILLCLIFFPHEALPQSLDIGVGIGFAQHISNLRDFDPEEDPFVLSIGSFFNNKYTLSSDIHFLFLNNSSTPLIIFSYDHDILNTTKDKPFLLGDEILVNSFELSFGYGILVSDDETNFLIIPSIGYVAKLYEGKIEFTPDYLMKFNYSQGGAVRVGLSAKMMNPFILPLSLTVRAFYDYGTVTRDNVEVSENGIPRGNMIPLGDRVLPDYLFSMRITVAYHLVF